MEHIISAKEDIVNCLAEAFAEVSDPCNCEAELKKTIKEREERKCIDFEGYNT